jgi:DEAD/DEAH box helicase domain-containing protein
MVDDVGSFIRSGLLESELEQRLIDTLRLQVGDGGLVKAYVLPNAAIGFQVRFGADGTRWSIEPQVDVGSRFGIAVDTRADFVFSPIGRPEMKPIIVYMDGWQFHADRIPSDVEKRLAIVRSRKAEVWSLTWDDLDPPKLVDRHYTSLFQDLPQAQHLALLRKIAESSSGLPEAFRRNADPLLRLMSRTSIEALMARLRDEFAVAIETIATFLAPGLGKANLDGLRAEGATVADTIEPLFDDCNKFGRLHRPGYEMIAGITREGVPQSDPAAFQPDGVRLLLAFDPARTADQKRDWNGLLHALNFLQSVPNLHMEMPGLENLALPSAVRAAAVGIPPSEVALGWIDLKDLVDEALHPLIDRFIALNVRLPDGVGVDLLSGDEVALTLEFAWSDCRIAIALGAFHHPEWRIVPVTSVFGDLDAFVSLMTVQGVPA